MVSIYKIKKKSKYLLFFIVNLVIIFLFLEIGARLTYPFYSNYNTEMWKYAKDIKKVSHYEGLSHEHRPHSEMNLYGVDVKINSDGFRDYEYSIEKGEDTFRILVLGDSITFGWGVEFENTFPKVLEQKLNQINPFEKYSRYEVINTGVGNYNTAMELITLQKKGLKYDPNLIILEYYINDAEVSPEKVKLNIFKKYSYLYSLLWDKFQNAQINFLQGNDYGTFYSDLYKNDFIGKENAKKSLQGLIRISKEKKIPLLIVIFPEFHNFKDYQFNGVTEFVSEIANSQNVPVLDLLPYYINYEPESIWVSYEDAHPNALGNKITAEAIYETIIKQNLIIPRTS